MAYRPLVLDEPPPRRAPAPQAYGAEFMDISDLRVAEFLRMGSQTSSGACVNMMTALSNTAVWRSVSLISYAIGMLPLQLIDEETKEKASGHPLYRLLHREPNNWQSAFDFRTLMQMRALVKGDGYAMIVWSRGKPIRLIPLDPDRTTPHQADDFTVSYRYQQRSGGILTLAAEEVFHLRGLTLDGIRGVSLVYLAREAIGLALAAERATARMYKNGSFVDGALQIDGKLSQEAYDRLIKSWDARFSGADNAGKTPLLEEGLKYNAIGQSAKDAQSIETRKMQVEEVARIFGVPRPLLMVDETSWGSGVEALGRFFVQHALNPWFEAWQQGIERSLLVGPEKDALSAKFNPGALLRGSTTDQANFFAKALGAGGSAAWLTANEVRGLSDLPSHPEGDELYGPSGAAPEPVGSEPVNEPSPPPPGAQPVPTDE
jgi:HK97 family phage portal protein